MVRGCGAMESAWCLVIRPLTQTAPDEESEAE